MSKKQLNNRLESLFAGFEEKESPIPVQVLRTEEGWNWECDIQGRYIVCGADVENILAINPELFVGQSIFSFSLANHSTKTITSIFQDEVFPCEAELDFNATNHDLISIRMSIFRTVNETGEIVGWHGFNQVLKRRKSSQVNKPTKKSHPPKPSETARQSFETALAELPESTVPQPPAPTVGETISPYSLFNISPAISTDKLSIPVQVGSKNAFLEISSTTGQKKWRENDRLLAEEVARQLALAMENARLYHEISAALAGLERRERYQANIAQAVALLSEKGTWAVPEVLASLGKASGSGRVVFMERHTGETTIWQPVAGWTSPERIQQIAAPINEPIACVFNHWEHELLLNGWVYNTQWDAPSPERECLSMHHVSSALLLAITLSQNNLGFIAFQDFGSAREWEIDEINILKVAANALTNAFNRESLLSQLQTSLEETEELYNSSHRLALANDPHEMVRAITQGLASQDFNRAVLILFDSDSEGKVGRIRVESTWQNGSGSQPDPNGTEYPLAIYARLLSIATPNYFSDTHVPEIEPALRDIFIRLKARSAAILPLWTSKRQTGAFLILADLPHVFTEQEIRTYPPLIDQLATAIENMRLFQQTQKALAETGLLYQISDGISQAGDTSELVRLVAQNLLPKNAEAASIFMVEYNSEDKITELELAGFTYTNGHYQPAGVHIPISAFPFVSSLKSEVLVLPDVLQSGLDAVSQKSLRQINILAACIVPLLSGGKLVGILVTSARKPAVFAPEEIRLLQIAGGGIAVALEKQRLLRQAQRRALELQTAAEIARDTTSTLSLEVLLNRIVTLLSEQFGYYHVAIYMIDDQTAYAVLKEGTGEIGKTLKQQGYKIPLGSRSIIGMVCTTGKPIIINDVAQNPVYAPHPLLLDTRSEMALPLRISHKVTGVLDIQTNKAGVFDPDEISVLQILTDQISVAIENAQSYELSQKALAEIKEVDRLKSQFLANMSHELRTPLNSIIGFSRVILKGIDGPINEIQSQDLSAIYSSGQHLLALITDILDLSKIGAGKMELQFSDVNISDMVNSAMSFAVGLVKDKPIKLVQLVPANLPILRADPTRVRQVIINFISNAAKFTDQGTITVEASVIVGPTGHREMLITVTDTGTGIAFADQVKLFQPFSQVDDSPTRKTGGTGLGLSISRSLIEMHNGRIGLLNSEVGKGSTFYFALPLRAEDPILEIVNQPSKGNVILCIDDDLQVIGLYERYLKPQDFQVIPLTNPKLAVQTAKSVRPYAITLDVMMPEIDGWQVLQNLKSDPQTREIPVIMCTILEEEDKGFNLGASEYLVKPFLQEDIIGAITRLNRDGEIRKVLVIDDDPEDLRLVEKMLKSNENFVIQTAQSGIQGWERIQNDKPDAVILDLFMPEMDGFSILANIRANKTLANLPVIVLTGADLTPQQHEKLIELGHQLLEKGKFRDQELLNTLETSLRSLKR
jgi:signal transduction histidine kinase/CheY-like chemotaxis protein